MENRLTVTQAGKGDGPEVWDRQMQTIMSRMDNFLPYSTGNYIQSPVMNHNGKEYEKQYMYN